MAIDWNDVDLIQAAVAASTTKRGTLTTLGMKNIGSNNYRILEKHCKRHGISLDFPPYVTPNKYPDEVVFVENSPHVNNNIDVKKRYLAMGYENICVECGQGPVWNGKPLVLQLDHINGIHNDHRIENLRILCPNCHTQTLTYAGRKGPDGRRIRRVNTADTSL